MNTVNLLLGVLIQGLKFANKKEANKYLDRALKIKEEYNEELRRPDYSQYKLDTLRDELHTLCETFIQFGNGKSDS